MFIAGTAKHPQILMQHHQQAGKQTSRQYALTMEDYLSSVAGQESTTHQQQSTDSSQARDGIGDGHEGAVEGRGHPPHRLVPTYTSQPKLSYHRAEHSAW